jgi:hypothetical protein
MLIGSKIGCKELIGIMWVLWVNAYSIHYHSKLKKSYKKFMI